MDREKLADIRATLKELKHVALVRDRANIEAAIWSLKLWIDDILDALLATPAAEPAAPPAGTEGVDAIVTALYRRFKDWSARGFGPDDVTWCEVKSDMLALVAQARPPAVAEDGFVEWWRAQEPGANINFHTVEAAYLAGRASALAAPAPQVTAEMVEAAMDAWERIAGNWRDRMRAALTAALAARKEAP